MQGTQGKTEEVAGEVQKSDTIILAEAVTKLATAITEITVMISSEHAAYSETPQEPFNQTLSGKPSPPFARNNADKKEEE